MTYQKRSLSMREQFAQTTLGLLAENPHSALVLADISTGYFPDSPQIINVGIREQLLIGMASGLAFAGIRPIVHSIASFLIERPWESIKLDLTHQKVGAILVSIYSSYDWPEGGRTHMSPGDVALLKTLEDWHIFVPGHSDEVDYFLRNAMQHTGNVYIRTAANTNQNAYYGPTVIRSLTESQTAVIAIGPMLDQVLEAVRDLVVTVIYTPQIEPFPREIIDILRDLSVARIILVEPYLEGTGIADLVQNVSWPVRILSIGVPKEEVHAYGNLTEYTARIGLDTRSLQARITQWLNA